MYAYVFVKARNHYKVKKKGEMLKKFAKYL